MSPNNFGINLLGQVLDAASLRHRVIAQNVANVNTPGYQRREVQFEDELAKAIAAPTDGKPVQAKVVLSDGPERVDGNNVDIDREMGELSKNGLLYQAAAQLMNSRLASLRSAISGR
jgi:flagellar basal-body rod protein FlgB